MKLIYKYVKTTSLMLVVFFLVPHSAIYCQKFEALGGPLHDYDNEFRRDIFSIEIKNLPNKINASFGVTSICLNISHTKVSDLKIQLMSPDGTSIWLTNRNGGDNGQDYRYTCFSNNGFNGYVHQGKAPFVGEYIPDGRLEFINNNQDPNGYWYLIIEDLKKEDYGVLERFSITFDKNPVTSVASRCTFEEAGTCVVTKNQKNGVLLPDLVIIPSFTNNQIKEYSYDDTTYPGQLRVAASIANIGDGPMEIQGSGKWLCNNKKVDSGTRCSNSILASQRIWQNIYYKEKGKLIKKNIEAGTMYFDEKAGHQHYHVDNWVELRLVKKVKTSKGTAKKTISKSNKISYCLFDTGICSDRDSICFINNKLYGPKQLANYGLGNYTDCLSKIQGISVGGYDTYGMMYEGQSLQLPRNLEPGWYYLQIEIDPLHFYKESNIKNNIFEKKIYLSKQ